MVKLNGEKIPRDLLKFPCVAVHESGHAGRHFCELMVHAVLVGRSVTGWLVRRHSLVDSIQSVVFCQGMRPDF